LTDKEVVRIVAAAVQGFEEIKADLKTLRKIGPGSNIWKATCAMGDMDMEFTLYVFPHVSPETLADMTRERLRLNSPRWQTTQTV
jgi:hypothetical protein